MTCKLQIIRIFSEGFLYNNTLTISTSCTVGPRFVVQIGEKTIDYNEEFRLFLTTRNPQPEIPPDAASVITEVNFTTTRAGLTGQVNTPSEFITQINIPF